MEQVFPQAYSGVDARQAIQMIIIENNAKFGKSLEKEEDLLVNELIQIGKSYEYLSLKGDVKYNKRGDHIRARDIGEQLNKMGGIDLMRAAHDMVKSSLGTGQARNLESVWDGIGDWLG
jgi:hypothetical protein